MTHASTHGYERLNDLIASYASSFDITAKERECYVRMKDDQKPSELMTNEEEKKRKRLFCTS
jgi:hypothetical protein